VATNVCLNQLRSRAIREPGSSTVSPEPALEPAAEAANLVRALIHGLSERQCEIAVLHFLDGLTQQEIAAILGLSRKTIGRDVEEIRSKATALGAPGSKVAGRG
jgi:RNA polymerase sigma-70 factor (ECF subfamily)